MKEFRAVVSTAATPGSLLSQYQLLRAVIDTPWATRLDHKIISHIIDRYYGKYEVARASLRYLEIATGATRTNIIESIRRIIEQGVVKVTRQGIGTRPTEYGLNFDFAKKQKTLAINKKPNEPCASGPVDDTSRNPSGLPDDTSNEGPNGPVGNTAASGIVDDTSGGPVDDTSSAPSGIVHGTESYLRNMPTGMLTVSRNEDAPAVPTAPPVSGLEAHTAATAVDPEKVAAPDLPVSGFEELWAAFPRKHDRSKAQAAYKNLAPDTGLHHELVTKATALAEHYEKTATERKWWKHLHNWLAEERYLEDLPVPYENPKEAAIARKRENGPRKDKSEAPAKHVGLSPKTPQGRHKVTVVGSDMPDSHDSAEKRMVFSFRIRDGEHDGKEFSHSFKVMSEDETARASGQSIFAALRHATGVLEPEDTSDLHDKVLVASVGKMGRIEYAPV
jgi:hypothetical protein